MNRSVLKENIKVSTDVVFKNSDKVFESIMKNNVPTVSCYNESQKRKSFAFMRPVAVVLSAIFVVGIGWTVLNDGFFIKYAKNDMAVMPETAKNGFYSITAEDSALSISIEKDGSTTNGTSEFTPSYIPDGYVASNGEYSNDVFSIKYTNANGGYFIITTNSHVNDETEISVSKTIRETEVTIIANVLSKEEAKKILDSIY